MQSIKNREEILSTSNKNTATPNATVPTLKKLGFWLLCFATPIATLCIVMACAGVFPFGSESFLIEDLKYQYKDFYHWFYRVLCGEESIFYSTACGLGANTWGLYTYYLASPFNLLILLFGESNITLFVFITCALKLGCMQITATFYLRKRFELRDAQAFIIALGYVWCLWTATNLCNPMWLDALVLLPLIMWAVKLLVDRGRVLPLALLSALNICVCWYTAYMTVLFCIMFTILEWSCSKTKSETSCPQNAPAEENSVAKHAKHSKQVNHTKQTKSNIKCNTPCSFAKLALRFATSMVVALLLSAWMFIPTVLSMAEDGSETYALTDIVVQIFSAGSFTEARRLIETTNLQNFIYGAIPFMYKFSAKCPQLYCGILLLVAFVAFFASKRINKRTKCAAAIFMLILIASITLRPLQAIWCGFREPSGFYSRPCIFLAPTLIWTAGFWLQNARENTHKNVIKKITNTSWAVVLIGIFVVADLTLCGFFATKAMHKQNNYSQENNNTYYEQSINQVSWLKQHDPSTWRMERTFTRAGFAALNEALSCNYIGLSSYSSVHNQSALDFLNSLGYSQFGRMHTRYAEPIVATDALLGLKYTSSNAEPAMLNKVEGAPLLQNTGIYENTRALSLGYVVAESSLNAQLSGDNPFERQNSFASALAGHDVQLYKRANTSLTTDTADKKTWQIDVPAGCLGYAYIERFEEVRGAAHSYKYIYFSIDGSTPEKEAWRFQHTLHALGNVAGSEGATHEVSALTNQGADSTNADIMSLGQVDCDAYYLDIDALDELTRDLSTQQVNFTSFSGKGIQGTVDAESDGWAMISVPHEDGWSITVNGESVSACSTYNGALTLIPVSKGENTIEMHFVSPGFYGGCAVSVLGVLAVVTMCVCARKVLVSAHVREKSARMKNMPARTRVCSC